MEFLARPFWNISPIGGRSATASSIYYVAADGSDDWSGRLAEAGGVSVQIGITCNPAKD